METMAWKPTPGTSPPNVLPSGHSQETVRFFPGTSRRNPEVKPQGPRLPPSTRRPAQPRHEPASLTLEPVCPFFASCFPKEDAGPSGNMETHAPSGAKSDWSRSHAPCLLLARPTEQARIRNVTAISGIPQKCDWQDRPFPVPATSAFPFRNRYQPHHG